MKKVGVLIVLCAILLAVPILAQSNGSSEKNSTIDLSGVDRAYQCLQDQIDDKESSALSLQEAVFSTLALGSQEKLKDKIKDEQNGDCWPDSTCTLKDTAQVLLAYDRINKNTEDIETYLLEHNETATDLSWFLIIDAVNHGASSCSIDYGSTSATVTIGDDLKISGNPGSCLSIVPSGFWLEVKNSCLDKTYEISCDQDFVTTLLYQKSGSDTVYISPNTNSASSSGTTTETINARCFKEGSTCDYEGSLWAALALQETGHDISSFIPYLLALAEDNKRFFPSSILYSLTNGEDQFSNIVSSQISNNFWQAPSTRYNKFYDTALGLLALQGASNVEENNAKEYLLDVQTPLGCWNNNNIRDTAFLLYSGWPNSVPTDSGTPSTAAESCEAAGNFCQSVISCDDSGGAILNEFECQGFGQRCCSAPPFLPTCSEINGVVCSANQQCSGTSQPSSGGTCCLGSCLEVASQNVCEEFGGVCDTSCGDGETQTSSSCGGESGVVCCELSNSSSGSSFPTGLIILFSILILLVVLAIIFRKKLQVWWFKFKKRGGMKSSSLKSRRPPRFPPTSLRGRNHVRPRRLPQRRPLRRPTKPDREMDDVFKKLRDMSK